MATDLPGILIVDDNQDNRYTLQLMLENDGHERIASAAGGNEAIALIEKEKFSLVLLDLMMPDLNGDEVLKAIKSDPGKRDIPVVMISADTNADKVSQCIELGADDYRNQAQALETQANRTLAVWRDRATQVSGKALPSGHWLTEGVPDETLAEVKRFLAA
jgi:CheY-like chemotaxis protein